MTQQQGLGNGGGGGGGGGGNGGAGGSNTPASASVPAIPLRDDAQMVDVVSGFLFPLAFIIFNIIYWMVYLNMEIRND